MSGRRSSDRDSFVAVGGILLLAFCCIVAPATLGAVAGAVIGSLFGMLAAVLVAACVAVAAILFSRRPRGGRGSAC